mmetsp:Transcript_8483/g.24382  ORF Transcript_8483/g.24382 Transcript_8483/m.24382 type:complete len:385 (-) Transcript_8483:311-1465(-)
MAKQLQESHGAGAELGGMSGNGWQLKVSGCSPEDVGADRTSGAGDRSINGAMDADIAPMCGKSPGRLGEKAFHSVGPACGARPKSAGFFGLDPAAFSSDGTFASTFAPSRCSGKSQLDCSAFASGGSEWNLWQEEEVIGKKSSGRFSAATMNDIGRFRSDEGVRKTLPRCGVFSLGSGGATQNTNARSVLSQGQLEPMPVKFSKADIQAIMKAELAASRPGNKEVTAKKTLPTVPMASVPQEAGGAGAAGNGSPKEGNREGPKEQERVSPKWTNDESPKEEDKPQQATMPKWCVEAWTFSYNDKVRASFGEEAQAAMEAMEERRTSFPDQDPDPDLEAQAVQDFERRPTNRFLPPLAGPARFPIKPNSMPPGPRPLGRIMIGED